MTIEYTAPKNVFPNLNRKERRRLASRARKNVSIKHNNG
jgi:hypothetical protein